MSTSKVYSEFSANGYLTAPDGAVAVNIPMWNNSDSNEIYILKTQQAESVQQEVGKKFAITVKAQGDGLTYQWYYKESYQKTFSVSSNKSSAYAYAMQSYMNGRQVYCVITDQYGNQVVTEVVTLNVAP